MRTILAVVLGKAIFNLSRFFKIGGGSAAPGLYALKLDPNLVEKLTLSIPTNIIITGTNGKTTTARMLAHFAKISKLKVIRNHTGSNLERGIASTLLEHSSVHPGGVRLNYDLGIWELDEAAFNILVPKINPKLIVFLNVFRDQLDRYGEVDSVVKNWCETLKKLNKNTVVLVNGDDANTLKLAKYFKGQAAKFGVKDYKIVGESIEYKKEQQKLDFEAKDVKLKGLSSSSFQLSIVNCQLSVTLPLPGIYHIYDFLASFAVGQSLGLDSKRMISSLKSFSPAFGRVEKLDFGFIFLIKNPAGATQVFETIAPNLKKNDRLLLALNDNLADGTDVSWIWDADFERLLSSSLRAPAKQSTNKKKIAIPSKEGPTSAPRNDIVVSGTRAYDLANRLKYAGFDPKNIRVETELKKALQQAKAGLKGRLYILPTYTAMLALQGILTRMGIKRNYWEEETN